MSAISASQAKGPRVHSHQSAHQLLSQRDRSRSSQVPAGIPESPGRPAPLPPLRLTRRGKVVLIGIPLVLLAALLLSLAGFFNSPAKASDAPEDLSVTPTVTVTVQPGESLWAIAGTVAPDRDARDVIADIVQLNNLPAGAVLPGQQLYVPTR
ncbi:LysM peptidoglycan-binding domain-containing protein [Arthrobacter sp. P2b]|uniref:LysM peptidoglycan-binding domain-containing protein n=1 Tax=Arthrobacter sp. P2b TaxID=1938741 RepID=UPI0009A750D2|nr:LysM peptidoglycan-binding domain-containing protein [Arthrobacter sp. P2b]SLJ92843.1 LysM domain-containing protein [Arthrobacter sp. P2b]